MENDLERRKHPRFEIKLPAIITQPSSGLNGNNFHLLLTRDISHSGAFFTMMKPYPYQGHVRVELLIEVNSGCSHCFLYMVAKAEVVRCDDSGLAVIFDEDFMLAPFPVH
ncbi:MAG: PilZ domain-containing protein [Desulfobulbaceae bacterium]|jgi:hypothetical protein|nr:PilZ domain-containing protein [Desulfobulbaceae bacterium]MDY0351181.1 PilZ domain-containing protein [Desulfobulbaceae bacterium]